MALDSIWQLTFKKPPLQSLGVVLKKNIHNYLKRLFKFSSIFQLHICVRMDFLHILQPKQHITTDWMQKQTWKSRCLLLSQTLKWLCKNVHNAKKFENHCPNTWKSEKQSIYIYTVGTMTYSEKIQEEFLSKSNCKASSLSFSVQAGYKNWFGRIRTFIKNIKNKVGV